MANSDGKKKQLFDLYSGNVKLILSNYKFVPDSGSPISERHREKLNDSIFCPICLHLFDRTSLVVDEQNHLTIEHLPPESLGGKPSLLLCQKCNNECGTMLDAHLLKYIQITSFGQGKEPLKVGTVINESIRANVELSISEDGTYNFVHPPFKKNDRRQSQLNAIDLTKKLKLQLIVKGPIFNVVPIALLKIAYLLAYKKFGAVFILNPNYNAIREQITNPHKNVFPFHGRIPDDKVVGCKEGIYFTTQPENLNAFIVVFSLKHENEIKLYGVFLPQPTESAEEFYKRLQTIGNVNLNAQIIADVDYLNDINQIKNWWRDFFGRSN